MSRGNLGLDVLPEKMALVQKAMTNSCNIIGKPILITRVVDTMVNAPRPTRCAPGALLYSRIAGLLYGTHAGRAADGPADRWVKQAGPMLVKQLTDQQPVADIGW